MQEEHNKRLVRVQQQHPSQASGQEETQRRQARGGGACRAAPTAELLAVLEMGGGSKSQ